jgi:hypothetical protein
MQSNYLFFKDEFNSEHFLRIFHSGQINSRKSSNANAFNKLKTSNINIRLFEFIQTVNRLNHLVSSL